MSVPSGGWDTGLAQRTIINGPVPEGVGSEYRFGQGSTITANEIEPGTTVVTTESAGSVDARAGQSDTDNALSIFEFVREQAYGVLLLDTIDAYTIIAGTDWGSPEPDDSTDDADCIIAPDTSYGTCESAPATSFTKESDPSTSYSKDSPPSTSWS